MGEHLDTRFEALQAKHRIIGAVRGVGLLWGIELVKDRETKEQFAPAEELGTRLTAKLRDRGLLTRAGNMIFVAPPLVINREEADTVVDIIDDALTEFEDEL